MKLKDTIKGFLKMTGHYAESAIYLAEHGYDAEYMRMLSNELGTAKNAREEAEGQALTAQAYMYRGELKTALEWYDKVHVDKLAKHIDSVFVNNFILCLFLMKKMQRASEIYVVYNKQALAENTLVMRRTIGIKEYIEKRYENAVTVFIKLIDQPDPRVTLMADICLVRSLLELDMKDRAAEIAELGFGRYVAMGDITAEVNRLKLKIQSADKSSSKTKSKKKRG